jgi:DNA-binding MarR family transcriptional regulator
MKEKRDVIKIDGETLDVSPLTGSLGFLTRVTHIQERDYLRSSGRAPLSPGVYSALVTIGSNPGIRTGLLASLLLIQDSNFTALVKHLVHDGLVERKRHPHNHRAASLTLTKKGLDLVARVAPTMCELDRGFASALPEREYRQLLKILRRLFEHGLAKRSNEA